MFAAGAVALLFSALADVTGIVFNDANGNGVRDSGEAGIAGVAVSNQDTVVTTDAVRRIPHDRARERRGVRVDARRLSRRRPVLARRRRGGAARVSTGARRVERQTSVSSTPRTRTSRRRRRRERSDCARSSIQSTPTFSSSRATSFATRCASPRPKRRATTSCS